VSYGFTDLLLAVFKEAHFTDTTLEVIQITLNDPSQSISEATKRIVHRKEKAFEEFYVQEALKIRLQSQRDLP